MYVTRKWYTGNWQPSTVSTNDFWRYFQISADQLPSIAEFTALFDAYKINAIKWEFRPRFDNFSGNDTTDTTPPGVTAQSGTRCHVIVDPKSTVTPSGLYTSTNLNAFMENGRVKTYEGNRPFRVYFKPQIANMVFASGGSVAGARKPSTWLQSTNITVPHYGFHMFVADNAMSGSFGNSFDVFITFYMAWKHLK